MKLWGSKRHKSARALIVQDGQVLVMQRKRHSSKTGEWIEYYSIPGGEIDSNELPEATVVRELREEMGVDIVVDNYVAHRVSKHFENHIYSAHVTNQVEPHLMPDSEEALEWVSERNQFIPMWVPVESLTRDNLRYYADYLSLIQQLARGEQPGEVLQINA
jgi:8-oxo-dGTP diphosphatase